MKNLIDIIEGLKINSKTKINKYSCKPKDRDELIGIIKERLEEDKDADLNDIDVSDIIDMSWLFGELDLDPHNIDISEWDVSNVTNMKFMFLKCENFNSDLSKWDVSNVTNMNAMFGDCNKFNCDLSNWDVSNVTNMKFIFNGCKKFNSDLSRWDVSSVKDMRNMFSKCENFDRDLSRWDVSNVTNMSYMFNKCKKFNSNLSKWDVSNVKDMYSMFYGCKSLKTKPKWYKLIDIIEGLKIGSKTKIGGYNPDELNGDNIKIYNSDDGEDANDKDAFWEDFESWLNNIEQNYDGFIFCKFKSLSESKDLENDIFEYSTDLSDVIKDKIITGDDYGYEVRLVQGHIEIDCINSGSRGHYYIYALPEEIYDNVEMWFDGDLDNDDEIKDLSFLLKEGNIISIEDK